MISVARLNVDDVCVLSCGCFDCHVSNVVRSRVVRCEVFACIESSGSSRRRNEMNVEHVESGCVVLRASTDVVTSCTRWARNVSSRVSLSFVRQTQHAFCRVRRLPSFSRVDPASRLSRVFFSFQSVGHPIRFFISLDCETVANLHVGHSASWRVEGDIRVSSWPSCNAESIIKKRCITIYNI